jgi:C4-type Zn-finger protein
LPVLRKPGSRHLDVSAIMKKNLSVSCPVCGRKTEYAQKELYEGAKISCPFCKLTLNLHGHMWQDIQKDLQKLEDKG